MIAPLRQGKGAVQDTIEMQAGRKIINAYLARKTVLRLDVTMMRHAHHATATVLQILRWVIPTAFNVFVTPVTKSKDLVYAKNVKLKLIYIKMMLEIMHVKCVEALKRASRAQERCVSV